MRTTVGETSRRPAEGLRRGRTFGNTPGRQSENGLAGLIADKSFIHSIDIAMKTPLWPRRGAACAASSAVFFLAACGGSSDSVDPVAASNYAGRCQLPQASAKSPVLPAPTGDSCIGKIGLHLADASRAEDYTSDAGDQRELDIKIWYPIASIPGGTRANYLEPAIAPLVKAQLLLPADAPDVVSNAKVGLPLQTTGLYPIIIFSPGYGMVVEAYTTLLEDLASHGFVVIAIDHPYISGAASLGDGRVVQALPGPAAPQQTQEFLDRALTTLVADQRQVLTWMHGPDTGLLAGHLDFAKIGIVGHSIGGAAAIQTARSDPRAKAGVDIDGAVEGDTSGDWPGPLMFLLSANHVADPTIAQVTQRATGPVSTYTVKDSGHLDFSDLKWLLDAYVPGLRSDALAAMGLGTIGASEAFQITRGQVLSFVQKYVAP